MILKPTTIKPFGYEIIGFDTETANNNTEFLMGCFSDGETFYDKQSVIDHLPRLAGKVIVCTNLNFDFYAFIGGMKEEMYFKRLDRGSRLLRLETNVSRYGELSYHHRKNDKKITFIDTGNYAPYNVATMGDILKIPKLSYTNIGKRPTNNQEWADMKMYCLRDAQISKDFTEFLFSAFNQMGATPKLTIGSTAMSCYTNKYLDRDLCLQSKDILRDSFRAYYGGRTETFERGTFKGIHPYDVNSLYPSVMLNEYPDPNSVRITHKNTDRYIWEHHGFSDVEIHVPDTENYPLLPFKAGHTLFPIGTFRGCYTHVELRHAMKSGYTIKNVFKTTYYPESMFPFRDMMIELWDLRLQYQKENSPMEKVVKLLMNNLYGKTGQKFDDMDRCVPKDSMTIEEINSLGDRIEPIGNFFRIKESVEPSAYCIPIWASYTTGYARMHMYDMIRRSCPVYTDTDSLYTTKILETNPNKLGGLKHENKGKPLNNFVSVRAKFYAKDGFARIKGVSKVTNDMFMDALSGKPLTMQKWVKFKEGKRRGLNINEIIMVNKLLNIEDKKRLWDKPFDYRERQTSRPIHVDDIVRRIKEKKTVNVIDKQIIALIRS